MFESSGGNAVIGRGLTRLLAFTAVWAALGVAGTGLAAKGLILPGMACAVAGLVGAVLTVALARARLGAPYADLMQDMEALAAGTLDHAVSGVERDDDIGRMARAMDVMRHHALAAREDRLAQDEMAAALDRGLACLAGGDLRHRIAAAFPGDRDRLRRNFNEAMDNLSGTIGAVAHATQGLQSGAGEIRAVTDDLFRRTEQQAASLRETVTSMNEIGRMMQHSAHSAHQAAQAIGNAHDEASEGHQVVAEAVRAMGEIEHGAQEIAQIINVIDGIAFQTNLLALNAGVEAARAGDAGKGFAVVANEVRALAQRSADAAKDIKALILTSAGQVGQGVTLVGQTGEILNRMVDRVGEISELVTAISASSETQSAGLQQANSAVGAMDRMTQQNAAMVDQSTSAIRQLAGEADDLARLVGHFRADDQPAGSAGRVRPRAEAAAATRRDRDVRAAPPVTPRAASPLAVVRDDEDWSEF